MYSFNDLKNEISQIVDEQERNGVSVIHPDWVTSAVMKLHDDITGHDSDFYLISARQTVRNETRKFLNKYGTKPEEQIDPQYVLEGFERLQPRYLVKVGGAIAAIRVQDMTSNQRRGKAHELRRMGEVCFQHADELERYDNQLLQAS